MFPHPPCTTWNSKWKRKSFVRMNFGQLVLVHASMRNFVSTSLILRWSVICSRKISVFVENYKICYPCACAYLLNGIVRLLRWHIKKSLLCLAKLCCFLIELLFVLLHTADSVLPEVFQWRHNLVMGLCQLQTKHTKSTSNSMDSLTQQIHKKNDWYSPYCRVHLQYWLSIC